MKVFCLVAITLAALEAVTGFSVIAPGAKVPNVDLHRGFPPKLVNMEEYCSGRNVVIAGLPGAFTPTCSNRQVPGYLEAQDALKNAGIDEIIVYCVNDGAVMQAWEKDRGTEGSIVTMFGDPSGAFTKAVGMEMTHEGPVSAGIIGRCKRWAMYVANGVVKSVAVAESESDPAGNSAPENVLAPALIAMAKA